MAKQEEMTLADVLTDPLILALARADGWSRLAFADEMHAASEALRPKGADRTRAPLPFSQTKAYASAPCCGW